MHLQPVSQVMLLGWSGQGTRFENHCFYEVKEPSDVGALRTEGQVRGIVLNKQAETFPSPQWVRKRKENGRKETAPASRTFFKKVGLQSHFLFLFHCLDMDREERRPREGRDLAKAMVPKMGGPSETVLIGTRKEVAWDGCAGRRNRVALSWEREVTASLSGPAHVLHALGHRTQSPASCGDQCPHSGQGHQPLMLPKAPECAFLTLSVEKNWS